MLGKATGATRTVSKLQFYHYSFITVKKIQNFHIWLNGFYSNKINILLINLKSKKIEK